LNVDRAVRLTVDTTRRMAALVDTPPSELDPAQFQKEAWSLLQDIPGVRKRAVIGDALVRAGLNGIHGVGRAALSPPRMLIARLDGTGGKSGKVGKGAKGKKRPHVALVGKGVTYDTGGLSMKRPLSMFGMKADMGGAAATLGAFIVLAKCGCPFDLSLVLCIAENAVGPKACKPDDVLRMHSGLSVEINNTDAEGRLLLADGVSWAARKLGARIVIDAATLTGAQSIATGKLHAAVIASDAELESLLVQAGRESGDLVHPLPFVPEFFRGEFNSPIADMRNSVSNRSNAQSSCAAQFIFEHLPGGVRWAHVDLAGPATLGDRGTGFGVALLSQTIRTMRGLEEPAGSGKRSRS
jgi:probable aminopeptidase NPEPL1